MNADWLFIDTDPTSAEVLAWSHAACEIFESASTPPHPRLDRGNQQSGCAISGVGAIALRTDDAGALCEMGVDLIVGESSVSLDHEISWLQAMQPSSTVVLWDTPHLSAMYRHGVEDMTLDLPQASRALLEASNQIRRSALEESIYLQLLGTAQPDGAASTDFTRFGVTVLTPGWATLQAIAQFSEAHALARVGAIPQKALDTEFQRAARTAVRAVTHFKDETVDFITSYVERGKATVSACLSVWGTQVPRMLDGFLHHAWNHRLELRDVGSGQVGEYVQARSALTDLAKETGLSFGLHRGHDASGRDAT